MSEVIQVDNLVKQYKKADKPSVDHITFHVKEGEFFAFLGPNGAGKTTTISILTTALSKTEGKVTIAGYDLEHEARQIRTNIGVIFQYPSLDPELTAEENIRLHASTYGAYKFRSFYALMSSAYKQRVEELAEVIGIKDDLNKKLMTFSGGMKRKLEIIRSLIHCSKIMFLDEPTQGLDAASRQSLWRYLDKVRIEENITIFLTTHYLEEAESANRICIMNKGKIEITGTPDQLKNRLLEKHMYVAANDQQVLKSELSSMGIDYSETPRGLKVIYQEQTPQRLLAGLTTPLTHLTIHQPSLEEAYLKLINEGRSVVCE